MPINLLLFIITFKKYGFVTPIIIFLIIEFSNSYEIY